jgi:hypothetical protein
VSRHKTTITAYHPDTDDEATAKVTFNYYKGCRATEIDPSEPPMVEWSMIDTTSDWLRTAIENGEFNDELFDQVDSDMERPDQ